MSMDFENSKELFIQGMTLDGKTFRPSDWAERLAGGDEPLSPGWPPAGMPSGLFPLVHSPHHERHQMRGAALCIARA